LNASIVPAEIVRRADEGRGRSDGIALVPARTAHVAVDLQLGFMAQGALAEVAAARAIVPKVNALSRAMRAAGALNVFLRMTVDLKEDRYWSSMFDRMSEEATQAWAQAFGRGGTQHALWPELQVEAGDLVLDKTRYSAFIPGASALDETLRARGIDTLVVTGTLTNCCCESTIRDAMQMGYKVIFAADAAAAQDDAAHAATLANLVSLYFAEVCTAEEVIERLTEAAPAKLSRG
jgi:ureidoacrylate peracid hydrolase